MGMDVDKLLDLLRRSDQHEEDLQALLEDFEFMMSAMKS